MKIITSAELARLTGAKHSANLISAHEGLKSFGVEIGLNRPHRLVDYLAQVSHESMGFHYDREIWGPTKAQKRYEGREDLGNTQPGDGFRFRGRGPIQITGRYNYRSFTLWCRERFVGQAPDFELDPDAVNTDPWEGLVALWYWQSRKLVTYSDSHAFRALTVKINGGTNGLADRQTRCDNIALRFLGFGSVAAFQAAHGLKMDGIGQITRKAMHDSLVAAPKIVFAEPSGLANWFDQLVAQILGLFGIRRTA